MYRSAIIFLCLLTLPLHANMGETVAQCVARYGKPVGYSEASATNPFGTIVFAAGKYTLIVFVVKEKEVGARVSKQDKSAFGDDEIQTIMNADSDGTPWTTAKSDDPACLRWERGDKASALYDKDKHILIFTSREMAQAMEAKTDTTSIRATNASPKSTNAPPTTPSPK
jgi:hypothetical protein